MTESKRIPPDVRQDFDRLSNLLIPFAQQMLKKHGEFYPFGAFMKSDGSVAMAAGYEEDEHPDSQAVIDLLTAGFREQAAHGELKATGICYDARTIPPGQSEKVDAIAIDLEHVSGTACVLFVPYYKGWLRRIRLGELFAAPGTPQVFLPPAEKQS